MRLSRYRLVLVSPLYAGNVGSVARVAANFELSDIRVVAPECDLSDAEARVWAKGPARSFLEKMRVESTLERALDGCVAAIAFTRRTGRCRRPAVELGGLAGLGALGKAGPGAAVEGSAPIALVFGREDAGLTSAEIELCTHICTFATGSVMPSLNLSHAVAVVLSRIYDDEAADAKPIRKRRCEVTASLAEVEVLFEHWRQAMIDAGLTSGENPQQMLSKIRRALARALLTQSEVAVLRAYLAKTQVALGARINARRSAR